LAVPGQLARDAELAQGRQQSAAAPVESGATRLPPALVREGEQQVIRRIRQLQGGGESLNSIARELNRRLVPTKKAGLWQANTAGKILHRVAARGVS